MFSVWFLGYSIAYSIVPETSLEDWTVNKVFFQHQNLNIIGYYPLRKVAGIVCETPLLSSASPATSSSFPPDITQFVVNRLGRSNVYIWLFLNTTTWCCWPPLLFLLLLSLLLFLHAIVFFPQWISVIGIWSSSGVYDGGGASIGHSQSKDFV